MLEAGDSSPYKTYGWYQLLAAGDTTPHRASVHALAGQIVSLKKGDFKYNTIPGITFLEAGDSSLYMMDFSDLVQFIIG
jgi:hypothetical protein